MRTPKPRPARGRAEDTGCRPTLRSASPAGGAEHGGPGREAKPGCAPSWYSGSVTQPSRLPWNQAPSKLSASPGLSRLPCNMGVSRHGPGGRISASVGRVCPVASRTDHARLESPPCPSPSIRGTPRGHGSPQHQVGVSAAVDTIILTEGRRNQGGEGRARGPGECRPVRGSRDRCARRCRGNMREDVAPPVLSAGEGTFRPSSSGTT